MANLIYRRMVAIHGRFTTTDLVHKYNQMIDEYCKTNNSAAKTIGNVCQYILKSRGIDLPVINKEVQDEYNECLVNRFEANHC